MKRLSFLLIATALVLTGCFHKEKTHVVIVPSFGAQIEGNKDYERYMEDVADFVNDTKQDVDVVVFTGGYSVLKDKSEAQAMKEHFEKITNATDLKDRDVQIITEDCSIIAWQNVANTKKMLQAKAITPKKVTIFGDELRKKEWLAYTTYQFNEGVDLPNNASDLVAFAKDSKVVTVNFEGKPISVTDKLPDVSDSVDKITSVFTTQEGRNQLQNKVKNLAGKVNFDVAKNLADKGCIDFESTK